MSGIAKWYKPDMLIGKNVGIVCNLAPRAMMGGKYMVYVFFPIPCLLSWICFWGTGGVICWCTNATKYVLSHLVMSDSLLPHVP